MRTMTIKECPAEWQARQARRRIPIPEDRTALLAWRVKVSDLPSVKNRSGQMLVPEDLRRLGF